MVSVWIYKCFSPIRSFTIQKKADRKDLRKIRVFVFEIGCWIWWSSYIWYMYLYWWSKCAFSILLSLARRFWNQILIWVSVRSKASASSNLLGLDMYSFLWYSSSNLQTRKNCVSGDHIIKQLLETMFVETTSVETMLVATRIVETTLVETTF